MKKSNFLTLSLLLILISPYLLPTSTLAAEPSAVASTEANEEAEKGSSAPSTSESEKDKKNSSGEEVASKSESQSSTSTEDTNSAVTDSSSASSVDESSSKAETSAPSAKAGSESEVSKASSTASNESSSQTSDKNSSQSELSKVPSESQKNKLSYAPNLLNKNLSGYSMSKLGVSALSSLFSSYDAGLFDSDVSAFPSVISVAYVEHWSGSDAYSHNLLSHRYGITAKQLDGFLDSTGIVYDKRRLNGAKLLEWEKESGLDVRAIIAIAMEESSLGTAGIATASGSNMFGYGAFDNNVVNAAKFSDEVAIKKLAAETIIQNKNITFKIQDEKAKKNAKGQLDPILEGGVYFTDTSGTGKRRAKIMQDIDTWIDQHGGTPAIPEELKHLNTTSIAKVPAGYKIASPINTAGYVAASYSWGQCTWYVYNRAQELGYNFDPYMGNGADWQHKPGYEITHSPKVGYAVSFSPGQAGADPVYGHVAIVEEVREDGSILISESNALGTGIVSYRTFTAAQASELTYVIGKKE